MSREAQSKRTRIGQVDNTKAAHNTAKAAVSRRAYQTRQMKRVFGR
jgi:hypothetical protein